MRKLYICRLIGWGNPFSNYNLLDGDMMGTVGVDVDMADMAKISALFLARTHKTQNSGIQI